MHDRVPSILSRALATFFLVPARLVVITSSSRPAPARRAVCALEPLGLFRFRTSSVTRLCRND